MADIVILFPYRSRWALNGGSFVYFFLHRLCFDVYLKSYLTEHLDVMPPSILVTLVSFEWETFGVDGYLQASFSPSLISWFVCVCGWCSASSSVSNYFVYIQILYELCNIMIRVNFPRVWWLHIICRCWDYVLYFIKTFFLSAYSKHFCWVQCFQLMTSLHDGD